MSVRTLGENFLVHGNGLPLTRFQFTSVFKRCLVSAGDSSSFGTHSFCIGAATEASRAGLPNADVQQIGHWQSGCFSGYVRPDLI